MDKDTQSQIINGMHWASEALKELASNGFKYRLEVICDNLNRIRGYTHEYQRLMVYLENTRKPDAPTENKPVS